ncbi:hypothetical protein C8A01DRAFT_40370 [Parachaetomium inaequale]|uniref:Uncharacterized protein n=1 Tax=Parachaetomium inaequale TaxID=2588326 RepID=A0AAN6SMY3_9PEZI|nr:hypothetical protein C8A01DRAFT_40370 [Parachaetomium inaequale]
MSLAAPLKRSLSRSLIRIIQRTLPLVKSRGRSWTTNAKTRMPIDIESSQGTPSPPYTKEEKDWLKRHWDGEFKFLLAYGMSIYKEEDREEGRRIVRAMMEQDGY